MWPTGIAVHIEQIKAMHSTGLTLAAIGDHFHVTRERVRQILAKHGVTARDGGIRVRTAARKDRDARMRDLRCLAKWGLSYVEFQTLSPKVREQYRHQKISARNRGIGFTLTLAEWLRIWNDSGKWERRGRTGDLYCMARIRDTGPYELGNVKIVTNRENVSEYARAKVAGTRLPTCRIATGVYRLYPGLPKPFVAKFGRKSLGHFRSPDAAIRARDRFMAKRAARKAATV